MIDRGTKRLFTAVLHIKSLIMYFEIETEFEIVIVSIKDKFAKITIK